MNTLRTNYLLALLIAIPVTTQAQEQTTTPQPAISYTFENDTTTDDTQTYPFTLHNNAIILQTDDGNRVLYTGTDNGYLDLGQTIGTEIVANLTDNYTITIDLCIQAANTLSSYSWAWAFTNSTNTYLGLINAAGNGNWYYEIKNTTAYSAQSSQGLTTDQWHTLTIVQQADTAKLYIDGTPVRQKTLTLKPSTFTAKLTHNWIARSPFSADAYMKNTLFDNFRIYDTALTTEQINTLYQQRPTSQTLTYDTDYTLQQIKEELILAKAVQYLHNQIQLPTSQYADIQWTYTPYNDTTTQATLTFLENTFTVTERADTPVDVGQLTATITYNDTQYPLFDNPLTVTIAPDDQAYGYLYCHMPNLVPNTGTGTLVSQVITYALGTQENQGLIFNELNRGYSIIDSIGTKLPWCRDAFLAKDTKRNCYYIVTTDLYDSADNGTSMLLNYSIGMFRSFDLINWTYTRQDLKQYLKENPPTNIYNNEQTTLLTYDKVSRVWAPQIIFIDDDPYIYYAMGNTDNGDCDHFYISKANEDFTAITTLQTLYDANHTDNILDADINYLHTDKLYHMSYRDYALGGILDITTPDLLNPTWSDPVTTFTDGSGYEASSVFRRINDDTWNVGNVNYSSNIGYHFHTANALLRNLQTISDMTGHLSPQHGSFIHITETEYNLLQTWSDLRALITDATQLLLQTTDTTLQTLTKQAQTHITTDNGANTNLQTLLQTLQQDKTNLRARLQLIQALTKAQKANFTDQQELQEVLDQTYNNGTLTQAITQAQTTAQQNNPTLWETTAQNLNQTTQTYYQTIKSIGTNITINNGDFSNNTNRWSVSGGTLTVASEVGEMYARRATNYYAKLSQTQRNLEEGYYLLYAQAFQRNGDTDYTGRDCTEGVEQINYKMFAGTDSVTIHSLYEIPYDGTDSYSGFANGTTSAATLFNSSQDNYANYLLIYNDGTTTRMNIGLSRPTSTVTSSDWVCFDNFQLYKVDNPTTVTPIKNNQTTHPQPIYNPAGIKVGTTDPNGNTPQTLPKGIYIINKQKIIKR